MLSLVCSLAPAVAAAPIPATVQAIRIPAENLAAILPGGLDMETIDPSVMRRIEKAVQLGKAFVDAKWNGSLAQPGVTQIERTEEPVSEHNRMWNMGMDGEIGILESSEGARAHSCKIHLGLYRKGSLADAKSPNFGDRLARRTKRVSGIFQVTNGSHTLLAALPQTPTDGTAHTLLFILSLVRPGSTSPAGPPHSGLVTIETFSMPMDDWHIIPETVRDDHPKLLEKCRTAVGRGRIERIDRISTCATSKDKVSMDCQSVVEMSYPTSFGIRDEQLHAKSWEYRMMGSSFERTRAADSPLTWISYAKIPHFPMWSPTLADGTPKDIANSRLPIFGGIRYDGGMLGGDRSRTCLLGIAPLPADGNKPTRLALIFASANCPGAPVSSKVSEIRIEVLGALGPSGDLEGDPDARIKSLLARDGSVEVIAAAAVVSERKTVVSSAMEWIYPGATMGGGNPIGNPGPYSNPNRGAEPNHEPQGGGDSILIPSQFSRLNQGSELDVEYQGGGDGGVRVKLHFKHSLRKPELPMATNHGASHLKPEKPVTYDFTVNENLTLIPGAWTFIKEIPLEPILGADDKAAKGQSCHLFARLVRLAPQAQSPK